MITFLTLIDVLQAPGTSQIVYGDILEQPDFMYSVNKVRHDGVHEICDVNLAILDL